MARGSDAAADRRASSTINGPFFYSGERDPRRRVRRAVATSEFTCALDNRLRSAAANRPRRQALR